MGTSYLEDPCLSAWLGSCYFVIARTSQKQKTLFEDSVAQEIWVAQVVHCVLRNPVREVTEVFDHDLLYQVQVAQLERRWIVGQQERGPEEPERGRGRQVTPRLYPVAKNSMSEELTNIALAYLKIKFCMT